MGGNGYIGRNISGVMDEYGNADAEDYVSGRNKPGVMNQGTTAATYSLGTPEWKRGAALLSIALAISGVALILYPQTQIFNMISNPPATLGDALVWADQMRACSVIGFVLLLVGILLSAALHWVEPVLYKVDEVNSSIPEMLPQPDNILIVNDNSQSSGGEV